MRIGLVADTFSVEKGTGIARYSHELRRGLIQRGLAVESICPGPPNVPFGLAINHALKMPYLLGTRSGTFQLVHATSPITALGFPIVNKPKVVTYHDLTSLLCSNSGSRVHTRLFAPLFQRIGKHADRMIADSSQTKHEMVAHLGVPAAKITVVNCGVSGIFRPHSRLRSRGFVIGYVGALSRRKGLGFLLRVVHALRTKYIQAHIKLVICGKKRLDYARLAQLAADLELSEFVHFTGSIPDERLVDTYNSFDVFVLPSAWEGFGLPILEAQRCGVPVIIREDAHIPQEVSACCLKATSEEDMADRIYEVLTNASVRRTTVERGLEYSQQFSWERSVQQTMGVYEEVLASR